MSEDEKECECECESISEDELALNRCKIVNDFLLYQVKTLSFQLIDLEQRSDLKNEMIVETNEELREKLETQESLSNEDDILIQKLKRQVSELKKETQELRRQISLEIEP